MSSFYFSYFPGEHFLDPWQMLTINKYINKASNTRLSVRGRFPVVAVDALWLAVNQSSMCAWTWQAGTVCVASVTLLDVY